MTRRTQPAAPPLVTSTNSEARLLESAKQAAEIPRGELAPAKVTRVRASGVVNPSVRTGGSTSPARRRLSCCQ